MLHVSDKTALLLFINKQELYSPVITDFRNCRLAGFINLIY